MTITMDEYIFIISLKEYIYIYIFIGLIKSFQMSHLHIYHLLEIS